jgi:3-oxoacyl-[acyl-carrier-protein] synthase II
VKIVFVYPRFEKFLSNNPDLDSRLTDYFLGNFTTPPSLGIPILASITPPEFEVEFVDDNNGDPINFDTDASLIAINCFTPQASRAFELADQYRSHGKKVIIGGFFPSFMAEECLLHCDSVNIGEGEPTWPLILEDLKAGDLKRIYKGGYTFDLSRMKVPARELFYEKKSYDWDEDLIQLTRGCSYNCAMCAIPAHMGTRIRFRPIDSIVQEISQLKYENVYLADDTLFFSQRKMVEYAKELFEKLVPVGKKYFVSSTMTLKTDKDFLDLIARAGVKNFYCTMNVDPVSINAIAGGKQEQQQLRDLVNSLEDRGIRFFGSCALGREWDDEAIADRILDLYSKAGIHTAEFFIFTPYPGTVSWERLRGQNRIIDLDWSHYNGAHVVSKPLKMSPEKLYSQFIKIWNEFYKQQKSSHLASLEPSTWKNGLQTIGKPLERQGVKGQALITGIGILSPIGNDTVSLVDSLKNSRDAISPITRFDTSHFRTSLGSEIRGFDASMFLSPEEIEMYDDLYLQYAITSARMAAKMAGISLSAENHHSDIALVLGTCNGGLLSAEQEYKWINGKSDSVFNQKLNLQAQYYGFGKALAHALGITGDVWVITTACSSTTGALSVAHLLIRRGYYKTVIVGGADTLCLSNMSGFNGLKAVSTGRIAPFSLPYGLNIGEASVFWVVEEMEHALLRHVNCIGKIAGSATTCDAYHPTSPDPRGEGVYRTMKGALEDAGLELSSIGCINAHGTGTEANDKAETKGISKLANGLSIPVTSTKSFFGHCMGTTGILEATCNLLAMNEGFIPPTLNFSESRPGCNLDYVPNMARHKEYSAFISANYAFGGNNAAVVITKRDYPLPLHEKKDHRIVITGIGTVTSLGLTVQENLDSLFENKRGIIPADRLGIDNLRSKFAGLVREFKSSDIDRRIDFTGMNAISRYATAASWLALVESGLKLRSKDSEVTGIVMGVCNGSSESDHMNSVFSSPDYSADINNFSNITANSTAGWVANALCLKGANMTVGSGHHAGLQALACAFDFLKDGRAKVMLASAADEIYPQTFHNYDMIDYLYFGEKETSYSIDFCEKKRKVLGEGAASVVIETLDSALERKAQIFAEMLGYGMAMDLERFDAQCLSAVGLVHAINTALERSAVHVQDIDAVVWAPQGNLQDKKVTDALQITGSDSIPLITTTFNTGYIESASILASLGLTLETFQRKKLVWNQLTGIQSIDQRPFCRDIKHLLAVGSSDTGYNYAAVFSIHNKALS